MNDCNTTKRQGHHLHPQGLVARQGRVLEPEDLGWWYTVSKAVKFRKCKVCKQRRRDDLDEETRTTHNKDCKGCAEIFQEPTKTGGKRAAGKGKQPTTKRVHTQVVTERATPQITQGPAQFHR